MSDFDEATTEDQAPTCKRCHQLYTIECGYEASKHGFCWPCCDEIVARIFDVRDDMHVIVPLVIEAQRVGPAIINHSGAHAFLSALIEKVTRRV